MVGADFCQPTWGAGRGGKAAEGQQEEALNLGPGTGERFLQLGAGGKPGTSVEGWRSFGTLMRLESAGMARLAWGAAAICWWELWGVAWCVSPQKRPSHLRQETISRARKPAASGLDTQRFDTPRSSLHIHRVEHF